MWVLKQELHSCKRLCDLRLENHMVDIATCETDEDLTHLVLAFDFLAHEPPEEEE